MKEPGKIRTFGFFGHGGSGKTTLADAVLFFTGANTRQGKVDSGTSIFDFDDAEIERKVSLNLALASCEHNGIQFHLVDTPGYADFTGEMIAGVKAVDTGVVVIDAGEGIGVGTEMSWKRLINEKKGKAIFINKLAKPDTDFGAMFNQMVEAYGTSVAPVSIPIGTGPNHKGVVCLLAEKAYLTKDGKTEEAPIPEEVKADFDKYREKLIEAVAELDEGLLESYLEGNVPTLDQLKPVLKKGIAEGAIFPLFAGDALTMTGLHPFVTFVSEYFPSPAEIQPIKIKKGEEEREFDPKDSSDTVAYVFKTVSDPHLGDLLYVRVFSGEISSGSNLKNIDKSSSERIGQILAIQGRERTETPKLGPGMIGGLVKLKNTHTGDTLTSGPQVSLGAIQFPTPPISVAIVPKSKGDEEKVSNALARIHDEDPTFVYRFDPELKQQIISGMGELHLDVVLSKLKTRYGVSVDTKKPRIAYRETITQEATAQGRHKKQSGGRGQFGDVFIRLEPLPRGEGVVFEQKIFGGAVPKNFHPAVEKGVREFTSHGYLAGYQMVDLKAVLYDGSYHTVDSSEIAFKLAAQIAMKAACEKAKPILLEPILYIEVTVPEEFMGDVMGDLNSRRGKIQGMDTVGRNQVVKATVPEAEMYKYATTLRSFTQGRGFFTASFDHYDPVPAEITQKVIAEAKKAKEE
ncbi:elongation factor G [candidate division WOR-3 bacterium]|nr:elongation factor G [candidate division WOR-3 bacterium]